MTDLSDEIETNAGGPQGTNVDGIDVQQHSLSEQIAADKYLASVSSRADFRTAFTRVKIVPPGTV